jgi:hypothetical protein
MDGRAADNRTVLLGFGEPGTPSKVISSGAGHLGGPCLLFFKVALGDITPKVEDSLSGGLVCV